MSTTTCKTTHVQPSSCPRAGLRMALSPKKAAKSSTASAHRADGQRRTRSDLQLPPLESGTENVPKLEAYGHYRYIPLIQAKNTATGTVLHASCAVIVTTRRCAASRLSRHPPTSACDPVAGVLARDFLVPNHCCALARAVVAQPRQLGTPSVCDP